MALQIYHREHLASSFFEAAFRSIVAQKKMNVFIYTYDTHTSFYNCSLKKRISLLRLLAVIKKGLC